MTAELRPPVVVGSCAAPASSGVLAGVRGSVAIGVASLFFGVSFGVLAVTCGFTALQATVMSAVVLAGAAQTTVVSVVGAGGSMAAGLFGAMLVQARTIPMGIAIGTSLTGPPWRRALAGQTLSEAGWAMASRGDGTYDRGVMYGLALAQYVTLVGGTAVGAFGGTLISDPYTFGIDAIVPAFFVVLVGLELRNGRSPQRFTVAALGAVIALVLIPLTPTGIPPLAASLAALLGLRAPA